MSSLRAPTNPSLISNDMSSLTGRQMVLIQHACAGNQFFTDRWSIDKRNRCVTLWLCTNDLIIFNKDIAQNQSPVRDDILVEAARQARGSAVSMTCFPSMNFKDNDEIKKQGPPRCNQ